MFVIIVLSLSFLPTVYKCKTFTYVLFLREIYISIVVLYTVVNKNWP